MKILFILLISITSFAETISDEEIIKNLDLIQNLDVVKNADVVKQLIVENVKKDKVVKTVTTSDQSESVK